MKIIIPLEILIESIEKSSIAALTKDAQDDERKKVKPTDSCIKITATKDSVVFESSSNKSSSKEVSVLHTAKNKDIVVEQEGACCVEASSYLGMLNTLPAECSVQLSYEENKDYGKDSFSGIIQPNGKLTTLAFVNNAEKARGNNNTFPIEEFAPADYSHKKVLFSIGAKTLKDGIDQVIFATDPTNYTDPLNRVAIVVDDGKLHLAGTDGKRCAIYSVKDEDIKIICDGSKILINGVLLQKACKSFDDHEFVDVIDCEDQEHIIIGNENTKVRLCVASEEVKQQFPNFLNILKIDYPISIVLNKLELVEAVQFLSQYNPEKSIYYIEQGKSGIKIEAARRGTEPESSTVECEPITASLNNPVAMSNKFILDGCEKMGGKKKRGKNKDCKIQISFSKDERKIKMQAIADTTFVYLQQFMTPG